MSVGVIYIYIIAILIAIYIGTSIGESGPRMRFLLLGTAPLLLLWVERLNERSKFRLLLAGILLISVQTPRIIPLKLCISEFILVGLSVVLLIGRHNPGQLNSRQTPTIIRYIPYTVFAFASLVPAIIHGDLEQWHTVALTPLLLIFVTTKMIHTEDDAITLIRWSQVALVGFLLLLWIADLTGNVVNLDRGWRFGGYLIASFGPIEHTVWSITLGASVALGFPAATMLLFRSGEPVIARCCYTILLVLFSALLILTASRGATLSALATSGLVLLLSGKLFRLRLILVIPVTLVILALFWQIMTQKFFLFPQIEHFSRLRYGFTNIYEFQHRMDILWFTVDNIFQRPLGYGFNYLWDQYRLDEAIVYSALLNGTGLIGFGGFVLIIGHMFWHFALRMRSTWLGPQRDLAAIGISTLVAGLMVGVVSESVMLYPVHSFLFWTIIAAAYSGTCLPRFR